MADVLEHFACELQDWNASTVKKCQEDVKKTTGSKVLFVRY